MIVADVSFIDIFWSMLWFFFLFIWIVIRRDGSKLLNGDTLGLSASRRG